MARIIRKTHIAKKVTIHGLPSTSRKTSKYVFDEKTGMLLKKGETPKQEKRVYYASPIVFAK